MGTRKVNGPLGGSVRVKPTQSELMAAYGRTVPDTVAEGLRILFVGINPSLYSAVVGHHFARPGNRFWAALHASGLVPYRLRPEEDRTLLDHGIGLTNLARRATARGDEVPPEDLERGRRTLARKIRRYRPRVVAILGVTAYRVAFSDPRAGMGPQARSLGGAAVWVLPNPSGLNAHYQIPDLARAYAELKTWIDTSGHPSVSGVSS